MPKQGYCAFDWFQTTAVPKREDMVLYRIHEDGVCAQSKHAFRQGLFGQLQVHVLGSKINIRPLVI